MLRGSHATLKKRNKQQRGCQRGWANRHVGCFKYSRGRTGLNDNQLCVGVDLQNWTLLHHPPPLNLLIY